MSEFPEIFNLGDCLELIIDHRGKTPKKLGADFVSSGVPVLSAKHVHNGSLSNVDELRYVDYDVYRRWMKEDLKKGDCLLSSEGATLGECLYWDFDYPVVLGQRLFGLRAKKGVLDAKYLYALMRTPDFQGQVQARASGTSVFGLRQTEVLEIEIQLPSLEDQIKIGEFVYLLNSKIDLLHRNNKTLEEMAETLFRRALENSVTINLGEIIEIFDNKRIPLSSIQRSLMQEGELYPYYGAATIMDYVNEFIFDGDFLLVGEDGTVQDEDGYPILQRLIGKAWVNNHTHVLKAVSPFTNDLLEVILKSTSVSHIVTGAVQPKINQASLKSLEIVIPSLGIEELGKRIGMLFAKRHLNKQQIKSLETTRNTLLPKLMSGQVRVQL